MLRLSIPQLVLDAVTRHGLGEWATVLFSERAGRIHTAKGDTIAGVQGP